MFNDKEMALILLAFNAGKKFSEACNSDLYEGFTHGPCDVADAIGYKRETLGWAAAKFGATTHIQSLK